MRDRTEGRNNPDKNKFDSGEIIAGIKSEAKQSGVTSRSRVSLKSRIEKVKKRAEEIDKFVRDKKSRKAAELADALIDYIYANFSGGEKTEDVWQAENQSLKILKEWDEFVTKFNRRLITICLVSVILIGFALVYSWANRDVHKGGSVFKMIDEKDFSALKSFLRRNPVFINIRNKTGQTPLDYAVEKKENKEDNDNKVIQTLIRNCTDIDARDSEKGETLLHRAAQQGHEEVISLLLDRGANVNIKNNMGEIPLHHAVSLNSSKIAILLILNGADVRAVSIDGVTPLHIAAENSNENMVTYLISRKVRVNEKDKHSCTPLHIAAMHGNAGAVEVLVKNGADINAKDDMGETPLHKSAKSGNSEVVEVLMKNGAYVNSIDNKGQTPLRIAVLQNHKKVAQILRKSEK
ncbi:MAG: ankyrin repeat domain-containing protein [Candidatus Eremiobacteraeota bacterium]|nr:ankyrin repeat domain-containing protein [Candidatus Eremiobacteraeota bacterium]